MTRRIDLKRLRLTLLLCLLLPLTAMADKDYNRLVIFGDSLSDPGNAFALTGNLLFPPYDSLDDSLIPDGPYAVGRGRFSNGRTWIERLARKMRLSDSARPALVIFPGYRRGANYAVGGTRARSFGDSVNLSDQVVIYLAQSLLEESEETLFVVAVGGNDLRDALSAFSKDPTGVSSSAMLIEALDAIMNNLAALYAAGARDFLLVNAPDIALTPAVRKLEAAQPGTGLMATLLTTQFNMGLTQLIEQAESRFPGVSITELDLQGLLNKVAANPAQYRIANIAEACIMPDKFPFRCRKPNRYLFGTASIQPGPGIRSLRNLRGIP
jgi:outer membrane lipase/esterase